MRTIKLVAILLVITSFYQGKAQDVDRKRVDIVYVNLPLTALPTEVETYHVNLKAKNSSWGNSFGNVYEAEKIKLYGYHRLADAGDADLLIESEVVNDLIFDKVTESKADYTYKKDKNSPEIPYTAYTYYATFYTPKLRFSLRTKTGKVVKEGYFGGDQSGMHYGNTSYGNHFSNSYSLSAAWRNDKNGLMAEKEREGFTAALNSLQATCLSHCMYKTSVDFSVRYVDERKGRTVYADLLAAKDHYVEAVSLINNDKINLINKLVQPDYEARNETMKKAIAIWEKALAEADYDNKKARIDSKIARHLYYNLALGYLWMDDFVKAREYAQGRKKDVGSWDKNFLSGIKSLSSIIDDRAARQEVNKWRKTMLADSNIYVYKDPATRLKEKEEALAKLQAERADSLALAAKEKAKKPVAKTPVKTTAKKSAGTKTVTPAVKPKATQAKAVTKNI